MSDQTPDPHDELLRAALEAEAGGVEARPELLEQIRRATAGRPPRRIAPWLVAAAAVAAVAGLGAVLLRDGDQELDVTNDPTSTTTTTVGADLADLLPLQVPCVTGEALDLAIYLKDGTPDADVDAMGGALAADLRVTSARYLDADAVLDAMNARAGEVLDLVANPAIPSTYVVDLADGADETAVRAELSDLPGVFGISDIRCEPTDPVDPPPSGQPPTLVALVREDGWLVTVDLASGQQRELHFVGDPNESSDVEEGDPFFIDSVDLSPDGRWVYFSTCCEPAYGASFRIPVGGGEAEQVAYGRYPRVSPDGRYVATAGGPFISVTPTAEPLLGAPVQHETTGFPSHLAWSPTGTEIAFTLGDGTPDGATEVRSVRWDGATLTPVPRAEDPALFGIWTPEGQLYEVTDLPTSDEREVSQDVSYRWTLWVDEAGVVREQAGPQWGSGLGERTVITGLPEALAADW